jgi:pyruvate/2-oxoglutarate dehydrogenase complex dihydrolipoamide dehydrogenase (E3) component
MCRQLGTEHRVGAARVDDITGFGEPALLKLVVGSEGTLIGIHIVGPTAGDLIHVGASILARGATVQELANSSFGVVDGARLYALAARSLYV